MSELRSQVESLRKRVVVSSGLENVPSLFLSPSEAAKIDVAEVHTAAVNSLRILAQYDQRLKLFEQPNHILHVSSIALQRELKTKEVMSLRSTHALTSHRRTNH